MVRVVGSSLLVLAIAVVIGAGLWAGGAFDAHATNPPSMDAMLIDMDPEDGAANGNGTFTPVNTSSSIGPAQDCARIDENDTLDADEDVTADTLTIDTTATNIPAANAIIGYQYYLLYNETNLTVQSQTANVAATNILARTPGSNLFNVSDPLPDTDGNNTWLASVLDIGSAAGESGSGVLDRLTVSSDAGATSPVVENLSLSNAVHLDVGGGAWFPDNANWDSDGDTVIDGVQNVARIALNRVCPLPQADLAIQSVDPIDAPAGGTAGVQFPVVVSGTVINNGPAGNGNGNAVLSLSVPGDCTTSPASGTQSFIFGPLANGATQTVSRTWQVTCTSGSDHVFNGGIDSITTVGGQTEDPDLSNNGPDAAAGDTTAVSAETDIQEISESLTVPPSTTEGTPFNVTISASVRNNTALGPVDVDTTFDLDLTGASGCSTVDPDPQTVQNTSIAANTTVTIPGSPITWSVTCSGSTGPKTISVQVTNAIDQLHVTDSNGANDGGNESAGTTVNASADLQVTNVAISAPASGNTGQAFEVSVTPTLHNQGLYGPVDASVTVGLNVPADCTPAPTGNQSQAPTGLAVSTPVVLSAATWSVTCTAISDHSFTGTATATITTPNVNDPDSANNTDVPSSPAVTGITGDADIKVTSASVSAPTTAAVGTAFDVTVTGVLHNNGTVTPVNADTTITLALPADCTTSSTNPAVIQDTPLALSTPANVQATFSVTCTTTGDKVFSGSTVAVAADQLHVIDGTPGNDSWVATEDTTTVQSSADLKVSGVTVTAPPSESAGVPFDVSVTPTVHNNGPETPVNSDTTVSLAVPADCAKNPDTTQVVAASLVSSVATPLAAQTWSVTCSNPSDHQFTGTATIAVTSPNVTDGTPGNNSAQGTGNTAVSSTADPSITSMTVDAPANATAGQDITVTVTANMANAGPVIPADVDITFDLSLGSSGCSKLPAGSQPSTGFSLGATGSEARSWTVNCGTDIGAIQFDGTASLVVNQLHVTDSNGANNSGQGIGTTTFTGQADLKVTDVAVSAPPASAANTPFDVTVTPSVHNNGPYAPVDANGTVGLNAPADCTPTPAGGQSQATTLPASVATQLSAATWSVTCTSASNHTFTGTAGISVTTANVSDPTPANDNGQGTAATAITNTTDIKVVTVNLTAPPAAPTNTPFNVSVDATLHNNGPQTPASADVQFDLNVPANCTKSPPNPLTTQNVSLPVSSDVLRSQTWSVTCTVEAVYDFTGSAAATLDQEHVTETNNTNDSGQGQAQTDVTEPDLVDVKVTSVSVDAPAEQHAGDVFPVTVTGTLHNNGPKSLVDVATQFNLLVPDDCVANASATLGGPGVQLQLSTPLDVQAVFDVSCDQPSFHQFTGEVSTSVTTENTFDTNGDNDTGSGDGTTGIVGDADLKVASLNLAVDTVGPLNDPVDVTVSAVLHNNGPEAPIAAVVDLTLSAPADCVINPSSSQAANVNLTISITKRVDQVWHVTCTETGMHEVSATAGVSVNQIHIDDPSSGNDSGGDSGSFDVQPPTPAPTEPPTPTPSPTPTATPTPTPTPTPTTVPPTPTATPTATPTEAPTPTTEPPTPTPTPPLTDVDNDGDGYSENQGDCNDADAGTNPGAQDIPGNGVDEDCNGVDAPLTATPSPSPTPATGPIVFPPTGGPMDHPGAQMALLLLLGLGMILGGLWLAWKNQRWAA